MEAFPIIRAMQNATVPYQRRKKGQQTNALSKDPGIFIATLEPQTPPDDENSHATGHYMWSCTEKSSQSRALQHVIPYLHRIHIAKWMINDSSINEEKNLNSRAVQGFPDHFCGHYNANIMPACWYWNLRQKILSRNETNTRGNYLVITSASLSGIKKGSCEYTCGSWGKKSAIGECVVRVSHCGVRRTLECWFSIWISSYRQLVLDSIENSDKPFYNNRASDPRTGILIKELIRPMWITRFMQCMNIVFCSQTGNLMVSSAKRELIDRQVAFHVGQLSRDLKSGLIREEDIFNSDEKRTLLFNFRTTANYLSVVIPKYRNKVRWCGEWGRWYDYDGNLGGGCDDHMGLPVIIFKNAFRPYPICGLCDDILGVTYRLTPKGFMDFALFFD